MKRLTLMVTLIIAAFLVNAQQNNNADEMRTLFGKDGEQSLGWYVGIEPGFTRFEDRDVWLGGLSGGMIIDHRLTVGLAGKGWTNRKGMYYEDLTDSTGAYLEGGYGGLLLEYTLFPKSAVHLTFPVIIGGGAASYVSEYDYPVWDEDEWDTENYVLDTDPFFAIEPGVRAEISLTRFMRINAGVSYRYVSNLDLVNTDKDMMNNFNANVGLKFGKF